jgi:hypothetical protein
VDVLRVLIWVRRHWQQKKQQQQQQRLRKLRGLWRRQPCVLWQM